MRIKLPHIARSILLFLMSIPVTARAAVDPLNGLKEAGKGIFPGVSADGTPKEPEVIIGNIIRILLSFVGMIFLIVIIWSGIQWMTAGGNEKKVEEAKKRITNASIGLAVIFVAYIIAYWVTAALQYAAESPR